MQCPGGTKKSSPVATGSVLPAFLLRKSAIEVNAVAAMLMSLQGAALGAWDLCTLCPPADPISQPSWRKLPEHRACERALGAARLRSCFFIPCPSLCFLAPLSQPKAAAQLPKQLFIPKHLLARATPALIIVWMSADFHIYVFQTSRSLPFLCVYSLQFLLTGCGLPLAARAQIEINEAASVFELPS